MLRITFILRELDERLGHCCLGSWCNFDLIPESLVFLSYLQFLCFLFPCLVDVVSYIFAYESVDVRFLGFG